MRDAPVMEKDVGDELTGLMDLVMRASTGPLDVRTTSSRRHAVTRGQRLVGSFPKREDALLFLRAADLLEHFIGGMGEVLARHHDAGDGRCAECRQPSICPTRRAIERAVPTSAEEA